MHDPDYAASLDRLAQREPDLDTELRDIHGLERLLDWFRDCGISFADLDIVTQDEYCHDLLAPLQIRSVSPLSS